MLLAFVRILSKHRESVHLDHRIAQPRDRSVSGPRGLKPAGPRICSSASNQAAASPFLLAPFGGELRDAVAKCLDLDVAHHLPLKCFASVRIAAAIAFACWTSK